MSEPTTAELVERVRVALDHLYLAGEAPREWRSDGQTALAALAARIEKLEVAPRVLPALGNPSTAVSVAETPYGFEWGPIVVERMASDDRLGWVVMVRPKDAHEPSVVVRVSPRGRKWHVTASGGAEVT